MNNALSFSTSTRFVMATLLLALLLNLLHYPEWLRYARPDWVTLVLIYWCMQSPPRVSIVGAWFLGLLLDILLYSLFGLHALSKILVVFLAIAMRRNLRLYSIWQQSVLVLIITSLEILVVLWVYTLYTGAGVDWYFWQSAFMSTLLWPVVYFVMRKFDRNSRIWD